MNKPNHVKHMTLADIIIVMLAILFEVAGIALIMLSAYFNLEFLFLFGAMCLFQSGMLLIGYYCRKTYFFLLARYEQSKSDVEPRQ